MNASYFPGQSLARRATVPISPMAPTAPMIDPSLDQYTMGTMQHRQMSRNEGQMNLQSQMQGHMQQSQMQNNSRLQSPMQSSVQQLQSPIQNPGSFQSPSNMRANQSVTPERTLPTKHVSQPLLWKSNSCRHASGSRDLILIRFFAFFLLRLNTVSRDAL